MQKRRFFLSKECFLPISKALHIALSVFSAFFFEKYFADSRNGQIYLSFFHFHFKLFEKMGAYIFPT